MQWRGTSSYYLGSVIVGFFKANAQEIVTVKSTPPLDFPSGYEPSPITNDVTLFNVILPPDGRPLQLPWLY